MRTVNATPNSHFLSTRSAAVGSLTEIAQNFKEQGNDYFIGKRFREAVGFYTQGVDAKPGDMGLRIALLMNRAACNNELSTFRIYASHLVSLSISPRELWSSSP